MSNISFSKIGEAILANKTLANHITRRMANLTPDENSSGQFDVRLKDGNVLTFKFGASGQTLKANSESTADKNKTEAVEPVYNQHRQPA